MSPMKMGKSLIDGCGSATTKHPCRIASIVLFGLLYSLVDGIKTMSAMRNSLNIASHDHWIVPVRFETTRNFDESIVGSSFISE
jgi:hypothetical protein